MSPRTSPVDFWTFVGCCLSTGLSSTAAVEVGNRAPNVSPYAVSDVSPNSNEFPFMAALGWTNSKTEKVDYLSGGMLIAPNIVLTAAHCVLFKGKLPDTVAIGGNHLNSTYNEIHNVQNFYTFPQYDDHQAYYDIALLQIERTSGKPPICLWHGPQIFTSNVTAIGYGVTQFAGLRTAELHKVNLIVFPEEVCKPFFKRQRRFRSGIVHSHLCAGDPEGLRDTCQGDSGGPLLVDFKGKRYAVGITSAGQGCSGFPPAIYTRISSYFRWIEGIVQANGFSLPKTCGSLPAE